MGPYCKMLPCLVVVDCNIRVLNEKRTHTESVLYLVGELNKGDVQQVWDSGQEEFPALSGAHVIHRQMRVQQCDQILHTHIQHLNTHVNTPVYTTVSCLIREQHSGEIDSCVITGAHACGAMLKPHNSPSLKHCCDAELDREDTVRQSWEKHNR